jgi:hypothetical protein
MNRTEELLFILNDLELHQPDVHPEFVRGAINLAAELDPIVERTTDERMADYAAALGVTIPNLVL